MVAEDFRAALERALAETSGDDRIGPLICATRMRLRLVFSDIDLELNVAASAEDQRLEWWFGPVDWEPRLTLEMRTEVAHRYLLGRESLAIALARRQVRVHGDTRTALLYLPATQLICEPYRRVVQSTFPALATA